MLQSQKADEELDTNTTNNDPTASDRQSPRSRTTNRNIENDNDDDDDYDDEEITFMLY